MKIRLNLAFNMMRWIFDIQDQISTQKTSSPMTGSWCRIYQRWEKERACRGRERGEGRGGGRREGEGRGRSVGWWDRVEFGRVGGQGGVQQWERRSIKGWEKARFLTPYFGVSFRQ